MSAMLISNCCSAPLVQLTPLCSDCMEQCEGVEAECECGEPLTERQARYDFLCDRCSYLSAKA